MNTQKRHDSDDDIDEYSLFEDEEVIFERRHKKDDHRPISRQPKGSHSRDSDPHGRGNTRRRDNAFSKASHAPD